MLQICLKIQLNVQVQKGSGTGEMGAIEGELTFEGYGPNGVAILVETMTDNRNRTIC